MIALFSAQNPIFSYFLLKMSYFWSTIISFFGRIFTHDSQSDVRCIMEAKWKLCVSHPVLLCIIAWLAFHLICGTQAGNRILIEEIVLLTLTLLSSANQRPVSRSRVHSQPIRGQYLNTDTPLSLGEKLPWNSYFMVWTPESNILVKVMGKQ